MYYVYQLIDPRDKKPFYIGKGTGNRINAHERDAKANAMSEKCDRIREIIAQGLAVRGEIIKHFKSEDAAYKYEAKLIKKIGRNNLTNKTDGGRGAPSWVVSISKEEALDKSWVEVICTIARKTNGFKSALRIWFGGKWIEFDADKTASFYNALKKKLADLYQSRGEDWINAIAASNKVTFSKVENLDGVR
jgi:hypothetical protein